MQKHINPSSRDDRKWLWLNAQHDNIFIHAHIFSLKLIRILLVIIDHRSCVILKLPNCQSSKLLNALVLRKLSIMKKETRRFMKRSIKFWTDWWSISKIHVLKLLLQLSWHIYIPTHLSIKRKERPHKFDHKLLIAKKFEHCRFLIFTLSCGPYLTGSNQGKIAKQMGKLPLNSTRSEIRFIFWLTDPIFHTTFFALILCTTFLLDSLRCIKTPAPSSLGVPSTPYPILFQCASHSGLFKLCWGPPLKTQIAYLLSER
jgi:hypothetical protein